MLMSMVGNDASVGGMASDAIFVRSKCQIGNERHRIGLFANSERNGCSVDGVGTSISVKSGVLEHLKSFFKTKLADNKI